MMHAELSGTVGQPAGLLWYRIVGTRLIGLDIGKDAMPKESGNARRVPHSGDSGPLRGTNEVPNKPSPPLAPRLLRLKQAAEYLSISPWLIREFVHKGKLSHVEFSDGGAWWFDKADLDRFIEQNKEASRCE